MSLRFNASGAEVVFSIGNVGQLGNGAFTMLTLMKVDLTNPNTGLIGGQGGGFDKQSYGLDTQHVFGSNDFSSGFDTVTKGDFYWIGISKAAGANTYRCHTKDYSTGGAWNHGVATGAATHTDPGVSTSLTVGANLSFGAGNGDFAVTGVWTSVLSDLAIEAACTSALSDFMAANPGWAAKFNVGATTAPILDLTGGGGNETSRAGSPTETADPPGYSFALGGARNPGGDFLPFFH